MVESAPTEMPLSSIALAFKKTEEFYRFLKWLTMWVAICVLGFFFLKAVVAVAGQSTNVAVQVGLKIISDVRVTVSWAVAGGCGAWAVGERKIRQKRVLELHARIKKLETGIDPNRSSSTLTPEGKTNPDDRSYL